LQSKDKEERVKLMIDEAAATELEALRVKYKSMVDENNALSVKVNISLIFEAASRHQFSK
jgi:hypothetical protein